MHIYPSNAYVLQSIVMKLSFDCVSYKILKCNHIRDRALAIFEYNQKG